MFISRIIEKANESFEIENIIIDTEFETLGLIASDTDLKICTFIDSMRYLEELNNNDKVMMVIATPEIAKLVKNKGIALSSNPRISFFKLHNFLVSQDEYKIRKDFKTEIDESSDVSPLAYVADTNVKIGKNVIIEEFVSIKENTIIGDNVFIGAGTIVGGDGFEVKRNNNTMVFVKHAGWTIINDNVSIQYNSTIDKAIYPWDATKIEKFCSIDNLVYIAHGVKLGSRVLIAASATFSGRIRVGDDSWIGVGSTLSNGIYIGKNSRVNIGAVATRNVEDKESVTGNFAIEHTKFIEHIKKIR